MSKRVLVLGATGMLGKPVTRCLLEKGFQVRLLSRTYDKPHRIFGDRAEIIVGSALERDDIQKAMTGCDAVHINLTQDVEMKATQHVVNQAADSPIERITYVSATTACEENRWFDLVDIKMCTEEILRRSEIAHIVFCPTWVMETLNNFIRGDRASVITGNNPPALHFFAAQDFGRMVAASYDDARGLGKRLFVHGPEGIRLPDALERFFKACYPNLKVMHIKLWQAKLLAKLTRREELNAATQLIDYFDQVGELGDSSEANELYGAPSTTLDEWCRLPRDSRGGMPH